MYLLCEQFFLLFLCVAFWFKTHFRAWQRNLLLVPMELRGLSHTVSVRFQFSVSWAAAPVVSCGIRYPVLGQAPRIRSPRPISTDKCDLALVNLINLGLLWMDACSA